MPKKGPDMRKIELIRKILRKNLKGLWMREIARKTGIDKSTVSIYLAKYMQTNLMGQILKVKIVSVTI